MVGGYEKLTPSQGDEFKKFYAHVFSWDDCGCFSICGFVISIDMMIFSASTTEGRTYSSCFTVTKI